MRFSLIFFAAGGTAAHQGDYSLLLDAARLVDDSPITGLWLPERHFTTFGGPYPSPSVLAAAVAVTTSRLRIRSGSVIAPLHDPLRIAEEWSVVDRLSAGRVELSFGSGWNVNDFVLAPDNYRKRRAVTAERIDTVRRLWRGEAVDRINGAGVSVPVRVLPRPVQPELPVWITAQSESTFKTAGADGLPVLTGLNFNSSSRLGTNTAAYWDNVPSAPDRSRAQVALMVHTFVGASDASARHAVSEALRHYLRVNLEMRAEFAAAKQAGSRPVSLDVADVEQLITRGHDRILDWAGLIGSPDTLAERIAFFADQGVQELACLVDFGVDQDETLKSIGRLCELAQSAA